MNMAQENIDSFSCNEIRGVSAVPPYHDTVLNVNG